MFSLVHTCNSNNIWFSLSYLLNFLLNDLEVFLKLCLLGCKHPWSLFKGKCYKVFDGASRRGEARKYCQEYEHGELASVPDQETNRFLSSLAKSNLFAMIGGYKDRAQQWHWYDGSPWQFENFRDGHPKLEDPFPTSTDLTIGQYWGKELWGENCCEYPWICQSSSGK